MWLLEKIKAYFMRPIIAEKRFQQQKIEEREARSWYYQRYDELCLSTLPRKSFKLTANQNQDTQDDIAHCIELGELSAGEYIDAYFDEEKERFEATLSNCYSIGYFPKTATKCLNAYNAVFVESVLLNEKRKHELTAVVFEDSDFLCYEDRDWNNSDDEDE